MYGAKGGAVTGPYGPDFRDPAGAEQGFPDVLRYIFRPQVPADIAAVADLMILCHKRDLAFSRGTGSRSRDATSSGSP